jgi:predicted membrane-bound mannosyltransferase
MNDQDDPDLLRAWRDAAQDAPGEMLDRRILSAARAHQARRRVLPLAAALAACLVVAFYAERQQQKAPRPVPVAELDTATIGLYEGRSADISASAEAMQEIMIHQAPVGSGAIKALSP